MLCAFFDVKPTTTSGPKFKVKGRSKKPAAAAAAAAAGADVKPSESSTTVMHAQFDPLPKERNAPRAYEADEMYELSDDESRAVEDEQWDYVRQDADKEETFDDDAESDVLDDDTSQVSRDDSSELSQSFEDCSVLRKRSKPAYEQKSVYSGPQLCAEDDDFLD